MMDCVKYILEGEVACKKNSVKFNRRTGKTYKTDHFRKWHDGAMIQVLSQGIPSTPIGMFKASFTFYHATKSRIDSDNQTTSLLDLLQDAHVITDDCWTCVPHKEIDDVYRKGKGGAEIVITPLTDVRK